MKPSPIPFYGPMEGKRHLQRLSYNGLEREYMQGGLFSMHTRRDDFPVFRRGICVEVAGHSCPVLSELVYINDTQCNGIFS